jgi:hypothetical protein
LIPHIKIDLSFLEEGSLPQRREDAMVQLND